eukprot:329412-Chlamydomonas_euryale.AAC.2
MAEGAERMRPPAAAAAAAAAAAGSLAAGACATWRRTATWHVAPRRARGRVGCDARVRALIECVCSCVLRSGQLALSRRAWERLRRRRGGHRRRAEPRTSPGLCGPPPLSACMLAPARTACRRPAKYGARVRRNRCAKRQET